MNFLQIEDALKSYSQDQLVNAMMNPPKGTPQFLVLQELNRRKRVESEFNARKDTPDTTVAEEAVASAGIPAMAGRQMAQALAPRTSVANNTGIASVQGMQQGGRVGWTPADEIYDPRLDTMQTVHEGLPRISRAPDADPTAYRRGDLYRTRGFPVQYEQWGEAPEMMVTDPSRVDEPPYIATGPRGYDQVTGLYGAVDPSLDTVPQMGGAPSGMSAPDSDGVIDFSDAGNTGKRYVYNPMTTRYDEIDPAVGAAAREENMGKAGRDWRTLLDKGIAATERFGKAMNAPPWTEGEFLSSEDGDLLPPPPTQAATVVDSSGGLSFDGPLPAEDVIGDRPKLSFGDAVAPEAGVGSPRPSSGDRGQGGGGGIASMGTADKMLADRMASLDADREQNKWMALAKFGLALMSSNTGNIGTDIGVAGQAGLGEFSGGLQDILSRQRDLEDKELQIALAREAAARAAAGGGGEDSEGGLSALSLSAGQKRFLDYQLMGINEEVARIERQLNPTEAGSLPPEGEERAALEHKLAVLDRERRLIVDRVLRFAPSAKDSAEDEE